MLRWLEVGLGRRVLSLIIVVVVGLLGLPFSPWVPLASAVENWTEWSRTLATVFPDGSPVPREVLGPEPQLSSGGGRVMFGVGGTTPGLYVRDVTGQSTVRADVLPDGSFSGTANGIMSGNGRYVVFVASCGGTGLGVYRRDVDAGVTVKVNTHWDGSAACDPADDSAFVMGVSPDGDLVHVFGRGRYLEDWSGNGDDVLFRVSLGVRWRLDHDGNPWTLSGGCPGPVSDAGRALLGVFEHQPYGPYERFFVAFPFYLPFFSYPSVTVIPSGESVRVYCHTTLGLQIADEDVRFVLFYGEGGIEQFLTVGGDLTAKAKDIVVQALCSCFEKAQVQASDHDSSRGLKSVAFDLLEMPHVSTNIMLAWGLGKPSILTYAGPGIGTDGKTSRQRRSETDCGSRNSSPSAGMDGFSCDEYPFASTLEGGAGAVTMAVPEIENDRQGWILSRFYRTVLPNEKFKVRIKAHESCK